MSEEKTFLEFINRIRAGDERAAFELVQRYEPVIRREVRLQLNDRNLLRLFDSMDVCQSVLVSFFVRTAAGEYDLREPAQLVTLLVRMAHNKLASAARREYSQRRDVRRRAEGGDSALESIVGATPDAVEELSNRDLLGRIRERFNADELQIAQLRGQGAGWEEIARQMGGTPQSRRMQFSRALDRVADELSL